MDFVHVDKVARLDHEIFDHSVKGASLVTQWNVVLSEFSCAELPKILDGFGTDIGPELHTHAASRDIANADVYAIVSIPMRMAPCVTPTEEDDGIVGIRCAHVPLHFFVRHITRQTGPTTK